MDTQKFKGQLEAERDRLIAELESFAERTPGVSGDWQAKPETANMDTRGDVAEKFEELEERRATEHTLETRLGEVEAALVRIDNGTFGQCEVDQEPIELDRLEANPAARTCKAHINALNGR